MHQFDKVEMFSFVRPEEAEAEHQRLLAIEEQILRALEIPYRVVDIAVGDLGAPAARKFDCEAWIPSQERYRELTSTSNTTDYQARRLNCRFRAAEGASPEPVNTLNGTAVAVGRTLIAIIENHQRADGSVAVPHGPRRARRPAELGGSSRLACRFPHMRRSTVAAAARRSEESMPRARRRLASSMSEPAASRALGRLRQRVADRLLPSRAQRLGDLLRDQEQLVRLARRRAGAASPGRGR